jgi:YidC/Oxa1 family membrane protein insertase
MTDMRRMILLGLLILIGMMLWNTWTAEHAPKTLSQQSTTTQSQEAASSSSPTTTATTTSVTSALPISTAPLSIKNRYVTIKTDVIEATLDRVGGNLVSVNLLKYPIATNQPNNPFVLLNQDPDTYYVATSGVTGVNLPPADQMVFDVTQKDHQIIFNYQNNKGIKITKTYLFPQDDYLIQVKQTINNQGSETFQGNIFNSLQRKPVQSAGMGPFNFNTYTGGVVSSPDKRYEKIPFKDMNEQNLDKTIQNGWAAMVQHYFLSAWIPENTTENYHYFTKASDNNLYTIGMQSPTFQVSPQQEISKESKLYVGPAIADKLSQIAPGLNLTVDYGILWFVSGIIFTVMKKIYAVIGNWGWSIVLVTLFIKILFYKLNSISFTSMAKMRALQPKLEEAKERCGEDRQKLAQATMELYRREKVNPLSGCLPLIVQIPVFLALYWVLVESVELRQAPFILWIHDLSLKDPYYILPLLMGLTIFIQQWLSPKAADPVQQKVMMLMPVIFTAMFLSFPAGLVLYWVANNSFSILQQWYIMNHVVPKAKK